MSTNTVNNDTFIVLLEFASALGSTPFFIASLVHILEKTPFFFENLRKTFIILSGILDSFWLSGLSERTKQMSRHFSSSIWMLKIANLLHKKVVECFQFLAIIFLIIRFEGQPWVFLVRALVAL
ncbi:hypothetical protein Y032_0363g3522 [Ancylostoma ceylanicum]|uniref:Uncharacterized protein n=1 Tax=Ancylostoma ceylanicum TaxID=53326 RepID=A0A016RV43_9BILA|nr:hypothetical protein Y032_0363g3522 [Ancylostoma ceylanicum]